MKVVIDTNVLAPEAVVLFVAGRDDVEWIVSPEILAEQHAAATYQHEAVEVPPGSPQVRYSERCDQWVPRGDVLRCVIHDEEGRRPVIEIDDREFTLEEFGTMLTTCSGWGMRIVFVPDDELDRRPDIVIGEPEDSEDTQ